MHLYPFIISFLLSFFMVTPISAEILTSEKEHEIRIYLENNEDMQVVMDEATKDFETKIVLLKNSYKKEISDADVSERFFEIMKEEFHIMMNSFMKKHIENINNTLFEFMHKNFTYEEVKELNQFYAHGIGKKLLEHQPEIYKISAKMSRNMMADVAPVFQHRLDERIEEEGIELFSDKPKHKLSQTTY